LLYDRSLRTLATISVIGQPIALAVFVRASRVAALRVA
jgi:hypothetical protein